LGSVVAEDGGARTDANVRIEKARGSFSKLRKVWLSTSIRKDTKIRIFNACVNSLLLIGCETWLVISELQRKIQTFVNRCLRYILSISGQMLYLIKTYGKQRGQEHTNLEIRKRKFRWIGHTLRKANWERPNITLLWNRQESRKRGRP
jgi:hypothetical protein